jgi:hypothetical protein
MTDETITLGADAATKRSINGQMMENIGLKSLQNSHILTNNQHQLAKTLQGFTYNSSILPT